MTKRSILVVEDSPPVRRAILRQIQSLNLETELFLHSASNGQEALEMMRRAPADIVITDIQMPVMDGLALLRVISTDYPKTIGIILSSYQEFEYAREALRFHAMDYLLKPISKATCETVLNKALAQLDREQADMEALKTDEPDISEEPMNAIEEKQPELIREIELYLQEHYQKPVTNLTLSRRFGFVPSYISKLFARHMGITPKRYLTNIRIRHAKELLASRQDMLIKDVAAQVGFSDAEYFSRVFHELVGSWPSEYQKAIHAPQ